MQYRFSRSRMSGNGLRELRELDMEEANEVWCIEENTKIKQSGHRPHLGRLCKGILKWSSRDTRMRQEARKSESYIVENKLITSQ